MVWSFVYLAVRKVLALVVLVGRSDRSKELEILVLRHELAVLRRRSGRPGIEPADRALLAALSQALPRRVWAVFSVTPETLLPLAPSVGGAALDLSAQEAGTAAACSAAAGLDPSTGAREPALGLSADRRRAQAARACGLSDHRAQGAERRWRSARTRAGRTIVGARSCASRPPARSLVISSRSRRSRCGGSTCSSSSRRRHADWS
jgi:hypothetical protein